MERIPANLRVLTTGYFGEARMGGIGRAWSGHRRRDSRGVLSSQQPILGGTFVEKRGRSEGSRASRRSTKTLVL